MKDFVKSLPAKKPNTKQTVSLNVYKYTRWMRLTGINNTHTLEQFYWLSPTMLQPRCKRNNKTCTYNIHASPLLYYLHISDISFNLITSISSTEVPIRILPVYHARMQNNIFIGHSITACYHLMTFITHACTPCQCLRFAWYKPAAITASILL